MRGRHPLYVELVREFVILSAGRAIYRLGVVIALVVLYSPTNAAVNAWTPIGPSGGYIRGLAFHPTVAGVLYSIAEERFYISTDNGASWIPRRRVFSDTLSSLAVDPTDGDLLYLFESNVGLWRSADRGESFTFLGPAGTDTGVSSLAISSDGRRLLAAAGWGTLLKSDDSGVHWSNITPSVTPPLTASYFVALAVDPTNKDILYAGMREGGVFKSINGGTTWVQLFAGPAGSTDYSIVIDPADHNHLLLSAVQLLESRDGGANWFIVMGADGPVAVFDPQDSNRIYLGSAGSSTFRTIDGGRSWELFNTENGITCGAFNSLLVDPRDSRHLVGGGDEGLCASTDGGATWTATSAGVFATRIATLRTAPGTQRRLLVGLSPGHAYVSSTTEGPWTRLDPPYYGGIPSGTPIVAFNPWASDSKWIFGNRTGGLRITSDAGATWLSGDSYVPFYDLAADASRVDTLVGATHFGILRSSNGGLHWDFTAIPTEFRDFASIVADPSEPTVFYAGAGAQRGAAFGVVKSIDGGYTWKRSNTGLASQAINRLAVNPVNTKIIYAAASASLSRSVDAGQSWNALTTIDQSSRLDIEDLALDPSNPDIIYAAHGVLDRSVDGGASWQAIYSGSWQMHAHRVTLDTLNPNIVYVGTQIHGVQVMEISPDIVLKATPPISDLPEGAPARIIYEVQNQGPFAASLVSLAGTFSQPASRATIGSNHGSCTQTAGTFTCSIGALAYGDFATVIFDFTPTAGSFAVDAIADAHESDPLTSNNATHITVTVVREPILPTIPAVAIVPTTPTEPGGSTSGTSSVGRGGGGSITPLELFTLLLAALISTGIRRRSPSHEE